MPSSELMIKRMATTADEIIDVRCGPELVWLERFGALLPTAIEEAT